MNHSEIAHRWAHQLRDRSNANQNLWYHGPTIYSYGTHFPIATMYPELGIILFTTKGYSNSTSKHIGHVGSAIDRTEWEVIRVSHVKDIQVGNKRTHLHAENIATLTEEIFEYLGLQERARKYDYTGRIQERIETLNRYIEVFKCKGVARDLCKKKNTDLDPQFKPLLKELLSGDGELQERINQLAAENEEKRKKAERAKREKDAIYVAEWLQGEHHASMWNKSYGRSDLLRMKGGMVETSKGVRLDPTEARLLWRIVEGVIFSETDKEFYGGELKIDHYSVNRISKDGDVRAGCHFISGKVIKEFVEAQGWNELITI